MHRPLALLTGAASPPSAPQFSTLVFVLMSLLAGSGGTVLWAAYMRRRRGKSEDEQLITQISQQVMEGARGLLEEYRIQIEVAKRQIDTYIDQMGELHRLLGGANARIAALEHDLEGAATDRHRLGTELENALAYRTKLVAEIEDLRRRIADLESGTKLH